MSCKHDDRRWKIVWLPPDQILAAFCRWRHSDYITLPTFDGLPADAVVVDVRECWERRQIGFRVWSASFEPVPEGDLTPSFEGLVTVHFVRLGRARDSDPPAYVVPPEVAP